MGPAPLRAALFSAALLFGATGCASLAPPASPGLVETLARAGERGFAHLPLQAGRFRLDGQVRKPADGAFTDSFTLYVEGDGAPWPTPFAPPADPTPLRPTALAMALADPAAGVAYLGRPCQYLSPEDLRRCDVAWWTERRFAPEVIAAYDEAADQLKQLLAARRIRLVGYSGGGVIAVLLAMRRSDVESVVTVAAPLSVGEWVARHGASPLAGSLDPAASGTGALPPHGLHYTGGDDEIVPALIVESFARRAGGRVEVVPGFDHECCWARDWPKLLERAKIAEDMK